MPDTPEEILERIIKRNSVEAEVKKGDANYGDHIIVEYRGKKQRFKIGGSSGSGLTRNG